MELDFNSLEILIDRKLNEHKLSFCQKSPEIRATGPTGPTTSCKRQVGGLNCDEGGQKGALKN